MESNQQPEKNDLFALPLENTPSPEPHPVAQEYPTAKLSIFQTSNVLDKNQLIESPQRSEQQRPFDNFFDKMNELGYEAANVSQTFILDSSNYMQKSPQKEFNGKELSEQKNYVQHQFSDAFIESKVTINSQLKKQFQKRIDQIDANVSGLSFEKHKIINCIRQYEQAMEETISAFSQQWQQILSLHINKIAEKNQSLQEQLQFYMTKCATLQHEKQTNNLHSSVLSHNINDLEEANNQLNRELQHIESENHELKYAITQSRNLHEQIETLQEQILNLNKTIDQNSQYIFDLEQKVAGAAMQLQEKQTQMKKQFEQKMEQQRQKIQDEYKQQFQKLHDQIQKRVEQQLENQYQSSLTNIQKHHQDQIQVIKSQYQKQIKQLQSHNIKLSKQNRQNESKRHEMEQHQMKKYTVSTAEQDSFERSLQQSRINQSLERKLKQKEQQLSYYRRLAGKQDTRQYAKKSHNILVVDSDQSRFIHTEAAVSPSSSLANLYQNGVKNVGRDDKINTILSRIRMRQSNSVLGSLNDLSISRDSRQGLNQSILRPVSPESVILEREKDMRMRNISHKLEQLRADIRRQIGMISN